MSFLSKIRATRKQRRGWPLIELETSSLRPGLANWHFLSPVSEYQITSVSSRRCAPSGLLNFDFSSLFFSQSPQGSALRALFSARLSVSSLLASSLPLSSPIDSFNFSLLCRSANYPEDFCFFVSSHFRVDFFIYFFSFHFFSLVGRSMKLRK